MYGQVDTSTTDERGRVPSDIAATIRDTRVAEQWERYDTILIGPGAAALDDGWFNTWADFANSSQLTWFSGRSTAVGPAWTNQPNERTDWAQDIWQTLVEFIAPAGLADFADTQVDATYTPWVFMNDLPNMLTLRMQLAESDDILKIPSCHAPSGFGLTNTSTASSATPVTFPGVQGQAHTSNGFKWPEPVMLAAKSKMTVFGQIDNTIANLLRVLPGPGNDIVPLSESTTFTRPRYYGIRITMRGPRYLQLRGARSSA